MTKIKIRVRKHLIERGKIYDPIGDYEWGYIEIEENSLNNSQTILYNLLKKIKK